MLFAAQASSGLVAIALVTAASGVVAAVVAGIYAYRTAQATAAPNEAAAVFGGWEGLANAMSSQLERLNTNNAALEADKLLLRKQRHDEANQWAVEKMELELRVEHLEADNEKCLESNAELVEKVARLDTQVAELRRDPTERTRRTDPPMEDA